jgi:hypothetical protein
MSLPLAFQPSTICPDTVIFEDGTSKIIHETIEDESASDILTTKESFPIVNKIVNGIVVPNLRVLLASVLGTIDASIPNKEQNKAVKHIMRKSFDDAHCSILERSYPDAEWVFDKEYILSPEPNRGKAFSQGIIK